VSFERDRAREQLVSRECEACGSVFLYARTGRRGRFCSAACRQRAWALRQAERTLGTTADTRPKVVREVVERVIEKPIEKPAPPPRPARPAEPPGTPDGAREWIAHLSLLANQLTDERSTVAREHWHHHRVLDILTTVTEYLDAAHPGGLRRRH